MGVEPNIDLPTVVENMMQKTHLLRISLTLALRPLSLSPHTHELSTLKKREIERSDECSYWTFKPSWPNSGRKVK